MTQHITSYHVTSQRSTQTQPTSSVAFDEHPMKPSSVSF